MIFEIEYYLVVTSHKLTANIEADTDEEALILLDRKIKADAADEEIKELDIVLTNLKTF